MTRRLHKSILAVALVTLGLPLLAALAIVVIANTESGTRWAIDKLADRVPGTLETSEFEGTLWRGVRFGALSYYEDDWRIDGRALALDISWVDLSARRLTIRDLRAESVTYRDLSVASGPARPLDLKTQALPITIVIEQGHIDSFVFAGEDDTTIDDVSMDDGSFDGTRIRTATTSARIGEVAIAATNAVLQLDGQVPLSATVRWHLVGGEWSGQGPVRGTLVDVEFDQFVDGPYPASVSGVVTPRSPSGPVVDTLVNWERWTIGGRLIEDGEARVRGWPDGYTLESDATVQITDEYRVVARGTASGAVDRFDRFDAVLENARGRAEVSGSLRWDPDLLLQVDVHAIDSGDITQVRANGSISPDTMALDLEFHVARFDGLTTAVTGSADGSGRLTGTLADPVLALQLRGTGLRVGDGPAPALDVALSGVLRPLDAGFVGVVEKATIAEPASGTWTLSKPTEIRIRDNAIAVAAHTWSGSNVRIRVERLDHSPDATAIVAVVDDFPLSLADAWLPNNARVLGTAGARVDLARRGDRWSGTATWRQDDTVLRMTGADGERTEVQIPLARAQARLDDGALAAEADLAIEPGVTARLETNLASLSRDSAVSADLRLQGDNWSWVSAVVPQIDRIEGIVGASITATGTLAEPDLSGTLEWRDGGLLVPYLNAPLDGIDVVVSGDKGGTATVEGTARSGNGTLAVNGRFSDVMSPSRSLQLRVRGESAELLNWPRYRVWVTPDIEITVDRSEYRIVGEVTVPKADIEVRELPDEAVAVSEDVRILGDEKPPVEPNRLSGEARLTLGENVHINALGLDSILRGNLLLRKQPARELAAEGRISLVDGSFTAYGRELAIRQGELTFTGPLDDPIVDVRAIREIETISGKVIAGIHLTGRAQNLTANVFSEPAMADADALSYLVVGRPLNQATEAESRDLSGAAVALGLRQANRLVDQIGQSIGLDQLSLTGDGGESTALVAGKQLNPRLYARYAYGVFSRLGAFLLRYRMTDALTLEAATGENHSIDVVYSVERP